MVSEDYLGLNDQLVLAVSHSKLLKSHLSFKYKCFNRILIMKYCSPIISTLQLLAGLSVLDSRLVVTLLDVRKKRV